MKNQTTWGAIRLCILGLFSLFNVGPESAALSGVITAPTGADDNLKTLGASQPVRDTLMGVIRSAFQLASATKTAILNFGVRKAIIVPSAQSVATVSGAAGVALLATLTKQGAGATTPWTVDVQGYNGPVEAIITGLAQDTPPKYSVEAIVNKIDEISEADVAGIIPDSSLMAVVNQELGTIEVYLLEGLGSDVTAHTAAVALAEDVQFVQTIDSGSAQFGE